MDNSEDQFNSLMAELMVRLNRSLSMGADPPPVALALDANGKSRLFVGVADSQEQLIAIMDEFREALSKLAKHKEIVASCVAHFQKHENCVLAELENDDNYCAQISIPVLASPTRRLGIEEMEVQDGYIKIFPLASAN